MTECPAINIEITDPVKDRGRKESKEPEGGVDSLQKVSVRSRRLPRRMTFLDLSASDVEEPPLIVSTGLRIPPSAQLVFVAQMSFLASTGSDGASPQLKHRPCGAGAGCAGLRSGRLLQMQRQLLQLGLRLGGRRHGGKRGSPVLCNARSAPAPGSRSPLSAGISCGLQHASFLLRAALAPATEHAQCGSARPAQGAAAARFHFSRLWRRLREERIGGAWRSRRTQQGGAGGGGRSGRGRDALPGRPLQVEEAPAAAPQGGRGRQGDTQKKLGARGSRGIPSRWPGVCLHQKAVGGTRLPHVCVPLDGKNSPR
ncbi:uncharacterized protein LOC143267492 [Peromyscus maniculatus bairdii]|uniref:uncharacterized protein LOC143267492 n=1 Tax=Peromyscus maniculatus bairdii TaxID=230844 RepID=UPI003FD58944